MKTASLSGDAVFDQQAAMQPLFF
jgi:hypothetical protein